MRAIPVVKMSGTGNDFLMIDNRENLLKENEIAALAKAACPRRVSAGADGIILVERASKPGHDFRMRIFNADGSEAEMCGNGSRCIAVFARQLGAAKDVQKIETLAGSLNAVVAPDMLSAKVQLSPPSKLEFKKGVDVLGKPTDIYFINTGVPHAVIFSDDVSKIDIPKSGAAVRYHEVFKPKGTNANFVQLMGNNTIKVRTYERGVEDETFACGTGSTASAIVAGSVHGYSSPVKVLTSGGATLTIHFDKAGEGAAPPFLEGAVDTIYKGEYYWRN
ncbi:MAG TPA: diaminopimelate epimerase [Planctomycetota bacterium]|nr:diaminopimelate epimerase [Planctomycetota bacterium]